MTALALFVALCAALSGTEDASAEVKGDLRLRHERPVSGTFNFPYRNYRQKQVCAWSESEVILGIQCTHRGYRVSKGQARVKIRTYRILEEVRKFDYYVVDVEVKNAQRAGSSNLGWMKTHIKKGNGVRLVDFGDTRSAHSNKSDCYSMHPSLGFSLAGVGASFSTNAIRFCGNDASIRRDGLYSARRVWQAHNLRKIGKFATERIVKVRRGSHPKFGVWIHVPTDRCTEYRNNYKTGKDVCMKYTNDTRLTKYTIHTK